MRSTHSSRYKEFLKRLRAARREAGLTQVAVARRLGQPQSFMSKCETGERRLDIVELSDLAELYGKPLAYFVSVAKRRGKRATGRRT